MGHANLTNISLFFNTRLYAKGKLTIAECVTALVAAGETLHASEGEYEDAYMLAIGLEDVIRFLRLDHPVDPGDTLGEAMPVIVPFEPTAVQGAVLEILRQEGGPVNRDEIFEGIRWAYNKSWRNRFPKIPVLTNVTH